MTLTPRCVLPKNVLREDPCARPSYLLGGQGHHWTHGSGRLQHVVSREILRRGTNGNLGLSDLQADLRPLRHRLKANAPLDQCLLRRRSNGLTSGRAVKRRARPGSSSVSNSLAIFDWSYNSASQRLTTREGCYRGRKAGQTNSDPE